MKHLLITAISVILTINVYSQSVDTVGISTTDAEYNYLTKGYKVDLADGRDVKSGYQLVPMGSPIISGNYTFEFQRFYRIKEKTVCAVLVIMNSKAWGNNTYYFCIPVGNSQLTERYTKDLIMLDATITRTFAVIASSEMARLLVR